MSQEQVRADTLLGLKRAGNAKKVFVKRAQVLALCDGLDGEHKLVKEVRALCDKAGEEGHVTINREQRQGLIEMAETLDRLAVVQSTGGASGTPDDGGDEGDQ